MIKEALEALRDAKRPVLIFGAGIRLAGAVNEARALTRLIGAPVAPTWGARDLFPAMGDILWDGEILCVGGFGTHGTRAANFTVQNADWILSVGSRLDSKATGTPRQHFARAARIFMVDIDPAEVRKFRGELGLAFYGVQADAKMFLRDMAADILAGNSSVPDFGEWRTQCVRWMGRYPTCRQEYRDEEQVNPYVLFERLARRCEPGEIIAADTGLGLAWLMQQFAFKRDQQVVHALNQTPMGYGLPAAIGAAFARPGQRVVLITGDGGFMLNLQELVLLASHQLPIKIVLLNNKGHAMCRQTQEQWLGGNYYSTSLGGGLSFPDFNRTASASSLAYRRLWATEHINLRLEWLFEDDEPALLEVELDPHHRLVPQVAYGDPNEDGGPKLPREELREQMIVELVGE